MEDETDSPTRLDVPDEIAAIIDGLEVDRVLLASSMANHEEMLDLVRAVRRPDVQVSIVPRYFEIFTSNATLDDVEGMPVVTLPPMRLGRSSRLLKRSFDISVSAALLFSRPSCADRARDPARQPRAGALPAASAAAGQRLDLQDRQVPDDARRRRAARASRSCT